MSDDETTPKMLARLGTDAMLWAQEFNKTAVKLGYSEMDEGWLIGWFANAIENCDVIRCNQLRAELAAANTRMSKLDFERTAAELERDALLARLAPANDEALVERDALKKAVEAEQSMTNLRLGPFLKKVRQEKQMTLRAVEEATDKEISNAYLSQLESGKIANPSPHVLYTLSLVFGVAYETLMERAGYVMPAPNRLAPVEDEALVEIAADAISTYVPDQVSKWGSIKDAAIDAIAAIRPHIEAAERERLREDIKSRFAPKSAQQIRDETDRLIEKHRQSVSDWLEAGSWKQSGAGNE